MKTLTLSKINRDLLEANQRVREQARDTARRHVIEVKRRLCSRGRTSAYVDGHFVSPIEGRTDRRG